MSERVVLITGCSSGIGRATAEKFQEAGWRVWATARNPDDVTALEEQGCETASLDVTAPEESQAVVDEIIETEGRLDCLVNNAGYGQAGAVEDVPHDRVHAQFDVNVYGPLRLIRAVLEHMRARETGTIINVTSVLGRVSYPTRGMYAGSKHALEGISDALRNEVAGLGIDVVVIEPGAVDTGFDDRVFQTESELDQTDAYRQAYDVIGAAQRLSSVGATPPESVAEQIVEAATADSPKPRYTVGLDARLLLLSEYLPTRVTDWLIQKVVS
jgi:NAD(P)-dependent dehydrogenase (short-subunit alcohol dehydrogenase family)